MRSADLSEYATGELIWELKHREGVITVQAEQGGAVAFRLEGAGIALVFPEPPRG